MKKSLLGLLLAALIAMPVFAAEKGDMYVNGKLGLAVNPCVEQDGGDSADADMTFALGAEYFYTVDPAVAVGVGVRHTFNSKINDTDLKVGYTNIYAAVKPELALQSDIFDNVYFIGQVGFGIVSMDGLADGVSAENGLYWGVGIGTQIMKNYIAEVLYTSNSGQLKVDAVDFSVDTTYSTVMINLGYKFSL